MSLSVIAWNDYDDGLVEYPDRLRIAALNVTTMAEEMAAGSGEVELDDSTADFYVYAFRPIYFLESAAAGDPFFGIIGPFWTETRRWQRGNERTGSRRTVTITLRDINSLLSLRVQKGGDAEREAETDVERITWLINTAEVIGGYGDHGFSIEETEFFFTDDPVQVSESNYTGQYSEGVLNDCIQQSGANCYLYPAPLEDEPLRIGIWYGRTERTEFASLHKISNDPADISPEVLAGFYGTTPQYETGYVFPPSLDATLDRDPSRQITGAMVEFDGDHIYRSAAVVEPTLTRRDMVFDAALVKNITQATARADRYVDDLDTEDDAIECAVEVPDWLVHAFVAGNRVQFKNTYMPGYQDDYVWMRVAKVTVRQVAGEDGEAGGLYSLALDLRAETPPGPPNPVDEYEFIDPPGTPPPGTIAIEYRPTIQDTAGTVLFPSDGDNPVSGDTGYPIAATGFSYLGSVGARTGFVADVDARVDIYYQAAATLASFSSTTLRSKVYVNGVAIGEHVNTIPAEAGAFRLHLTNIELFSVVLTAGDEITVTSEFENPTGTPNMPGTSGGGEQELMIANIAHLV